MEDSVVYNNIRKLSNNQLDIDLEKVKAGNLFEPQRRERRNDRDRDRDRDRDGDRNRSRGKRSNYKRRRN